MTMKQTEHAHQVVDSFKGMLPDTLINEIGDNHFEALALLIESAISSSVLLEMEKAADQIDQLAHKIRNGAEHFDK